MSHHSARKDRRSFPCDPKILFGNLELLGILLEDDLLWLDPLLGRSSVTRVTGSCAYNPACNNTHEIIIFKLFL